MFRFATRFLIAKLIHFEKNSLEVTPLISQDLFKVYFTNIIVNNFIYLPLKLQPNCPEGSILEVTLNNNLELLFPIGEYQLASTGNKIDVLINVSSKNKFKINLYIDDSNKRLTSSAYPTLFVPVIKTR